MRIIFPLLIVVIASKINPIEAMVLAASRPVEYSRIMHEAHLPITAFGGTFLMMVALTYFCDREKDIHWFDWLEEKLVRSAAIRGSEIAFVLLLVEVVGGAIDAGKTTLTAARGGFGAFLYLEVLDASFSFDGVIGALNSPRSCGRFLP